MTTDSDLDIFLVTAPGLEELLRAEAVEKGFRKPKAEAGGVTVKGDWSAVWRANLELRGASKVLVRLDRFRAAHLSHLEKAARALSWGDVLRRDVPVRVEAVCKKSKIYHSGAVAERIANAIKDTLGAPIVDNAPVVVKARIFRDVCTLSLDTSGEPLHKRGHKEAVNKAPMRENLAALFLRACDYKGREPVLDPMCGSGTFVIEAAEIAARLNPGRTRAFAFENLATFDASAWQELKGRQIPIEPKAHFWGFDQDPGAVRMSRDNAERAGVAPWCRFEACSVDALVRPDGPPGLIIINPPYGTRIGEQKKLSPLYRAMGDRLQSTFGGWRVGLVTNAEPLALATGLSFETAIGPVDHGGLGVKLYISGALA